MKATLQPYNVKFQKYFILQSNSNIDAMKACLLTTIVVSMIFLILFSFPGSQSVKRQKVKDEGPVLCSPGRHTWITEYCRVCVVCRECTGFSSTCQCADFPNRIPRE